MQCLNPIYITSHLFGHKTQIQLVDYVFKKRSLRIIYFLNHNSHTSPFFREGNILKLPDKIALENCPRKLPHHKYFNKCLPIIFKNWFTLSSDFHDYNTRLSNLGCTVLPPHNTKGTQSILALSTHGIVYRNYMKIIFFINYHQVSLR